MNIKLCDRKDCTGCKACLQKCNHGAISMVTENSFYYPEIDKSKCKSCGLCMNVCPILNLSNRLGVRHEKESKCFAVWNKDMDVRMKSSSGGTFSVFAEYFFAKEGVVYGAAWDNQMNLIHKGISNREELDVLRRSKYVQSDTSNTYNEVKKLLLDGINVLYCGTPCQIAALTSFLDKKYENLLTIDVLCQGVPSPILFDKYIREIEGELGWKVIDANFRSKDYGWRCGLLLKLKVQSYDGGKIKIVKRFLSKNEYYNAFYKEYFMRPSCYNCQFKCERQGYYSDLTIADFWRIGNKIPLNVKNYTSGISAVIVNTEKGSIVFNECTKNMEIIDRTWKEFETNGGLRNSDKPSNNDEAFEYLQNHTWRATQNLYFSMTIKRKFLNSLYLIFGERIIRKFIKR